MSAGEGEEQRSGARATRKRRVPLEWKIFASSASALLVLLVTWLWQTHLSSADESRNSARHALDVIASLDGVRITLLESEGAARGYLSTNDPSYAVSLGKLEQPGDAELAQLAQLVADNPVQRERQARLDAMVRARLDLLEHVVELAQAGERSRALETASDPESKASMTHITALLNEMRVSEDERLTTQRAAYFLALHNAELELWGGAALAVLIALLANLLVWRDVKDRARTEALMARRVAELDAANRARDDMLAIVSHDLRNPLNTVAMSASLLKADTGNHEIGELREVSLHERIERAVARMNGLIQDLLDASRIDAGRLVVAARPEPAASIVDEAVEAAASLAEAKSCAVARGEVDESLIVQADRERVLQLFSNLMGNALKFTPEGGKVTVSLTRCSKGAEFIVADTGRGIEADALPHLFDRYWKGAEGSREGAGLGLYIARGIVEAHGGTIRVDSSPGHGTAVHFTLPMAKAA